MILYCHNVVLCLLILFMFMGFLLQKYWSSFPFPSPVDHVLSELCTVTCLSWVSLDSMAQFHWVTQAHLPWQCYRDSVLKSRNIILLTKVRTIKAMVFPVVWVWELDHKEGWALKNWCFELWCWRRLLRVSWAARRLNQSILK